ncbi:MAG: RNA 2',3'-cyclic phosphodiesterase [Methylococcales bacterium]
MTEAQDKKRLFFALWPSGNVRKRMEMARKIHLPDSGRWTKSENLHATLVFLGNVATQRIPLIEQAVSQIQAMPFEVRLDVIRPAPTSMAWLVPSVVPTEWLELVCALQSRLLALDFEIEQRDYRAHVTLIRKLAKHFEARLIDPVYWQVNSFSLVESRQSRGSSYIRSKDWPLRA